MGTGYLIAEYLPQALTVVWGLIYANAAILTLFVACYCARQLYKLNAARTAKKKSAHAAETSEVAETTSADVELAQRKAMAQLAYLPTDAKIELELALKVLDLPDEQAAEYQSKSRKIIDEIHSLQSDFSQLNSRRKSPQAHSEQLKEYERLSKRICKVTSKSKNFLAELHPTAVDRPFS